MEATTEEKSTYLKMAMSVAKVEIEPRMAHLVMDMAEGIYKEGHNFSLKDVATVISRHGVYVDEIRSNLSFKKPSIRNHYIYKRNK